MVNKFLKKYLNIFTILILFLIYVKSKNYFLEILALSILIIEVVFLILFYLIKNKLYTIIQTPNSKDIFVRPHPYLPYETKPNFLVKNDSELQFNSHSKFFTPKRIKTNSLGFANGVHGNREINKKKINICCLGASTTANYFYYKKKNISYPILLEDYLKKKKIKNVNVNNFGQGGYNSQELIIVFLTKIIFTNPKFLIIYHGHNDYRDYFADNFKDDYYHSRVSLYKNLWKLKISHFFSFVPLGFINKLVNKFSLQNSLINFVSNEQLNFKNSPKKGLDVYKKNIECIIDICKERKIKVILSTFCFNSKLSKASKKIEQIINEENKIIRKIAKKKKVSLVDNDTLIKKDQSNFIDSIHFSPYGMENLAKNYGDIIAKMVKSNK